MKISFEKYCFKKTTITNVLSNPDAYERHNEPAPFGTVSGKIVGE